MKKRTQLSLGLLIFFIVFSCVQPVLTQSGLWTWGNETIDNESRAIWGDGEYLYSDSVEWDSTPNKIFHKWDTNGTSLLNISFSEPNWTINDIKGSQGALYTCGNIEEAHSNFIDAWIAKWDENWTQIWNRTWHTDQDDDFYFLWTDGDVIYSCGKTHYEPVFENSDNWLLVKWDSDGNKIWDKIWSIPTFPYDYEPVGMWCDETNVFVTGKVGTPYGGFIDTLVKWNSDGERQWEKMLSWTYSEIFDIWGDGTSIYTCGTFEDQQSGMKSTLLVKWSYDGTVIWDKMWGTPTRRDSFTHDSAVHLTGDEENMYTVGYRWEDNSTNEITVLRWDFGGKVTGYAPLSISANEIVEDIWSSNDTLYLSGNYDVPIDEDPYFRDNAYILKFPKDSIAEINSIPGYSVYVILSVLLMGVCALLLKYRKNPNHSQ